MINGLVSKVHKPTATSDLNEEYVFWDMMPSASSKIRRFGGTYLLHQQGGKKQRTRKTVSDSLRCFS
jgi:hypothetical protein